MWDEYEEGPLFSAIVWAVQFADSGQHELGIVGSVSRGGHHVLHLRAATMAMIDAIGNSQVLGLRADEFSGEESKRIRVLVATERALLMTTVEATSESKASGVVLRRPWSGFLVSEMDYASGFAYARPGWLSDVVTFRLRVRDGDFIEVSERARDVERSATIGDYPRLTPKLFAEIVSEYVK